MRISTAALYTIVAFLAKDFTSQAIAAPPPDITSDSPNQIAPDAGSSVLLDLVTPVAPAESIPMQPISAKNDAPLAVSSLEVLKPLLPEATVELPKPDTPLALPGIVKPELADEATAKPDATPTASIDVKPITDRIVSEPTTPPSPSTANAPVLQTLDAEALDAQARSNQVNAVAATIPVQTLSAEELAALEQQAENSSLTGQRRLALNTLIAPNLAENAIVAFDQEPADVEDSANPFDASFIDDQLLDGSLLTQSICEAALSPQQMLPSGICPPDVTVENSPSPSGSEANPVQLATAESTHAIRQAAPSAYSVYPIPSRHSSARDYYNLSVRPPAQLSNGNTSLLFPLSIPAIITSPFGWRTHPVTGAVRFHSGTDIGAPQGTPVLAAFDGQVEVSSFLGGYGLTVVLRHHDGTEQTLYAHLSEIFVQPGDVVRQGEVIGRVGSTGLSTGPHLHFEFRRMTQEGWIVLNAGPALEYALAQMGQSPQVAQAKPNLDLPSPFRYSGKFLDFLRVASQPQERSGS